MELELPSSPTIEIFSPVGLEEMGVNIQEMFENFLPPRPKRRVTVAEALKVLAQQEAQKLIETR